MTHEIQQLLEHVVLVKVEANIYGARKKLKKEDLVLADGSVLPPEDLASLGSKRLLDPDQLTIFNRLKKEAERICLRVGTRFLGGFALPESVATDVITELERISQDFASAKTEFLARYPAAVNDWVVRHPEFAGIIEQAVDSVELVSTRLSFDFLVVTVGLPDTLPPATLKQLETKIGSLSEQMFYEISVDASQFIEQSLLGKDQLTRNALRPIRRMRDKLDGLSFLDYRIAPVVNVIDQLLTKMPDKGAITGGLLQEIMATALLLADPDKTRRHGEGLLVPDDPFLASNTPAELAVDSSLIRAIDAESLPEVIDDHPSGLSALFDGIFDDDNSPAPETTEPSALAESEKNNTVLAVDEDDIHCEFWF